MKTKLFLSALALSATSSKVRKGVSDAIAEGKALVNDMIETAKHDATIGQMTDQLEELTAMRDKWVADAKMSGVQSVDLIEAAIADLEERIRDAIKGNGPASSTPDSDITADDMHAAAMEAANQDDWADGVPESIKDLEARVDFEASADFEPTTRHPEASCPKEEAASVVATEQPDFVSPIAFGAIDIPVDTVEARGQFHVILSTLETELLLLLSGNVPSTHKLEDFEKLLAFVSVNYPDYFYDINSLADFRAGHKPLNSAGQVEKLKTLQLLMQDLGLVPTKYEVGTVRVYATPAEGRAINAVAGILTSYGYVELATNVKCAAEELQPKE